MPGLDAEDVCLCRKLHAEAEERLQAEILALLGVAVPRSPGGRSLIVTGAAVGSVETVTKFCH